MPQNQVPMFLHLILSFLTIAHLANGRYLMYLTGFAPSQHLSYLFPLKDLQTARRRARKIQSLRPHARRSGFHAPKRLQPARSTVMADVHHRRESALEIPARHGHHGSNRWLGRYPRLRGSGTNRKQPAALCRKRAENGRRHGRRRSSLPLATFQKAPR